MQNVPHDDIVQTLEMMRRSRLSILQPEESTTEDTRSTLERYYDTLPHVKAEREQEEAERQAQQSMPLNGAQVLRAALAGGTGTVNGGHQPTVNSAAEVIAEHLGGISGRFDHSG